MSSWQQPGGSTPIVAGSRGFHGENDSVRAFDSGSGAPLWRSPGTSGGAGVNTTVEPSVAATVSGRDLVFAGEADIYIPPNPNSQWQWGAIDAFDATNGQLVWSVPTGSVRDMHVAYGTLFAFVNLYKQGQSDFAGILAIDPTNGNELFRVRVAGSSLAVANGSIFAGGDDGSVAVAPAAGCGAPVCSSSWTAQTGSAHPIADVAVGNGILLASGQGGLWAFNATGCAQTACAPLWSASGSYGGIALANGRVYATSRQDPNVAPQPMRVFDASGCGSATCTALWSSGDTAFGVPTVANGVVYAVTASGSLEAWNASGCGSAQCGPLWSVITNEPNQIPTNAAGTAIVTNGRLYVNALYSVIRTYVVPPA